MATRRRWTKQQKLHTAIIAVAAVLAIGMVGAAAWVLTRPLPPGAVLPQVPAGTPGTGTVVATSQAGVVATTSVTSVTAVPTTSPGPSTQTTVTATAGRRIAFHLGKTLYISSEDGKTKTPMHVVGTDYALSPDGTAVAAVEKGKLLVAEVGEHLLASSALKPGLTAEAVAPVWLPDGSAVLFLRADDNGIAKVWSYHRQSRTASVVAPGNGVAVSPDGRTIALLPVDDEEDPSVKVGPLTGGGKAMQFGGESPSALALGSDRVFVAVSSASGSAAIWSAKLDGSDKKKLVGGKLTGDVSTTFGEGALMLSPDGKKLLFSADGDDGYSRLFIVPTTGGAPVAISGRRDEYAIGWSRDGKHILFISGNEFQDQSTALMISDMEGHNRVKLVTGATR